MHQEGTAPAAEVSKKLVVRHVKQLVYTAYVVLGSENENKDFGYIQIPRGAEYFYGKSI